MWGDGLRPNQIRQISLAHVILIPNGENIRLRDQSDPQCQVMQVRRITGSIEPPVR
jgi:hypothetical protein